MLRHSPEAEDDPRVRLIQGPRMLVLIARNGFRIVLEFSYISLAHLNDFKVRLQRSRRPERREYGDKVTRRHSYGIESPHDFS